MDAVTNALLLPARLRARCGNASQFVAIAPSIRGPRAPPAEYDTTFLIARKPRCCRPGPHGRRGLGGIECSCNWGCVKGSSIAKTMPRLTLAAPC